MTTDLRELATEDFCYMTTRGRISGRPHTIEIWFALRGDTLYMLSGGLDRADWVRNSRSQPRVTVRIKDSVFQGLARSVRDAEEDAVARQLIAAKYPSTDEEDLTDWYRDALPVAVDLEVEEAEPS
ncbi:MAG: nitroreductase family deazaflavin-dependent oxidoreductase [Chloroflexi bacterium]|nr:MAG: nitroreductase family deazaflavin-dependent oxidoreductase [Chloroflexota bacterium]